MLTRRFAVLAALALVACAKSEKAPDVQQASATLPRLSAMPDQYFDTTGVRVRYRDAGLADSGPPIIFIHGYSRSLEDWNALADSLSQTHRVIAYDVRGFGKSTKSGDPRQYGALMADEVVALMNRVRTDKAHLVGHSMGAAIAANVAARYPDRVASATLIAGPMYPDSVTFAKTTARWVRDMESGAGLKNFLVWLFPGMPDSVARGGSAEAFRMNDSATMVAVMKAVPGLAVTADRASKSTVPVFIAAGGTDPLTPTSRALSKVWPRATYVEVPGVDHVAIVARPEVLAGIRAMIK